MSDLAPLRDAMRAATLKDEAAVISDLLPQATLSPKDAAAVEKSAKKLVKDARRKAARSGLIEQFLQEYGLSNQEGVALMRLAEALLRTPDAPTADALIRDKIERGDWNRHAGKSSSFVVNVSTRGLMTAATVLERTMGVSIAEKLRSAIARVGEPVIRTAVGQAMSIMGEHFVLGETIDEAIKKGRKQVAHGYTYSYDMLGEAALTATDAQEYIEAYSGAIAAIGKNAKAKRPADENPGISVKLSALHPRYEFIKRERALTEIVPRVAELARQAKAAGLGFNIDAEEADRLDVSLDVIGALLKDESLGDWDGFGVVVQAYQRRAAYVIDWLVAAARAANRRTMIRLVKGAYWDAEIKRAQVMGLESYPVFTRKVLTDVSFLACTRKLFEAADILYPQIATHNAHTAEAAVALADEYNVSKKGFEFQRLHGMGEAVHERLLKKGYRSRIYAPCGGHEELLPYLVRRLLENGANSSFVNQLFDPDLTVDDIVHDPVKDAKELADIPNPNIPDPRDYFDGERLAAEGLDWTDPATADRLIGLAANSEKPSAGPIVGGVETRDGLQKVENPARLADHAGWVVMGSAEDAERAADIAAKAAPEWAARPAEERAAILRRAADMMEAETGFFLGLAVNEAGKSHPDAIAEVREAVDFLRYYADRAEDTLEGRAPLGVVATVNPWNFPLAIFTGQTAAGLAAGNAVIAKPAETTPLIAAAAVRLLHKAGVPEDVLHFVPGPGSVVGQALVEHPALKGVIFTGSTATAQRIRNSLIAAGKSDAVLIAETGGINAMIVDSTALLEQATKDVVASAFQSAGQRCSAARIYCVQDQIYDKAVAMLSGAMDELAVGDPAALSTDVGPIIDAKARDGIREYIEKHRAKGRVIAEAPAPADPDAGYFLRPAAIRVDKVADVEREVFGPVLHVTKFKATELDALVDNINALGYGLTMGVHTRIDAVMERVAARAHVGNVYVNRNQIGAVVGVQPFGGEGLSGTGPKAGGPHYLRHLTKPAEEPERADAPLPIGEAAALDGEAKKALKSAGELWARMDQKRGEILRAASETVSEDAGETLRVASEIANGVFRDPTLLPGPTGEMNTLRMAARGVVLCLGGPGEDTGPLYHQVARALAAGNAVLALTPSVDVWAAALEKAGAPKGLLRAAPTLTKALIADPMIDAVALDAGPVGRSALASLLAERDRPIVPILASDDDPWRYGHERTLTVNTTAAGGDVALFAQAEEAPE
ncbi:MAG: bifunctional proline dehydrogenase/L-glutamate gamma-semialdehyde dehydrogenase PutA [Pseudomonadota bacterium]